VKEKPDDIKMSLPENAYLHNEKVRTHAVSITDSQIQSQEYNPLICKFFGNWHHFHVRCVCLKSFLKPAVMLPGRK